MKTKTLQIDGKPLEIKALTAGTYWSIVEKATEVVEGQQIQNPVKLQRMMVEASIEKAGELSIPDMSKVWIEVQKLNFPEEMKGKSLEQSQ